MLVGCASFVVVAAVVGIVVVVVAAAAAVAVVVGRGAVAEVRMAAAAVA